MSSIEKGPARRRQPVPSARAGTASSNDTPPSRSVPNRPGFSNLRPVTSDHIDTVVLDPHDHHHPHEDDSESQHDRIEEEEEAETHSDRTLREEASQESAARSAADVEKAEKKPKPLLTAKERGRSSSGKPPQDPETRQWKDDIVTFNSSDDPDNPKNWTYRHKARYFPPNIEIYADVRHPAGRHYNAARNDNDVLYIRKFSTLSSASIHCRRVRNISRSRRSGHLPVRGWVYSRTSPLRPSKRAIWTQDIGIDTHVHLCLLRCGHRYIGECADDLHYSFRRFDASYLREE